jgi:hypothetical protein
MSFGKHSHFSSVNIASGFNRENNFAFRKNMMAACLPSFSSSNAFELDWLSMEDCDESLPLETVLPHSSIGFNTTFPE